MTKKSDTSAAAGDVQKQIDTEQAQGFYGQKVDPVDNAEYTLTTGPDSPSAPTAGQINIADLNDRKDG